MSRNNHRIRLDVDAQLNSEGKMPSVRGVLSERCALRGDAITVSNLQTPPTFCQGRPLHER